MVLNNEFYEMILNNLYDGVYFVDRDKKILYWNRGAEKITGFSAEDVIGKRCWNDVLRHVDAQGNNLCDEECPILKTISHGKIWEAEVYLHHKDGHRVPVATRAVPIKNTDGEIIGAVEIFSDISSTTALTQKVKELQEIAFLDSLTHLANRRYIEINIQDRLSELNRYGWPFGIILADVDKFKSINDTYGHDIGDEVLMMVAKTLPACLRLFDIVGRWGGDEFVAIVINVRKKHLREIAQRFLSLVRSSGIPLEREILRVTVSTGVTLAKPRDTVSSVLKRADSLMYKSKASGGDCISVDR
ncbi:MAG TPA: sensor domain-containing diguanylate cyclase [Thermodesulfovibrionales bacterium]|nr:sensor domain-containing diguanylate cyclase [Thermodesulfovibrionales bacterium]